MSQIWVKSQSKWVKMSQIVVKMSQIVRNWSKRSLEDFEAKNGIFSCFSWKDYLKIDIEMKMMIGIYYKWQREEWWILIGEFRNDATKLLQFPSVMRQHAKKNMCLSNLYFFFQEDFSSSLSLVVRGSCLLIMQITGKSLIFVEILHKEKILLLDMMIHTVAKH